VNAPQGAGEISHGAPRVQQAAVEVVLQHLVGVAIEGHDVNRHRYPVCGEATRVDALRNSWSIAADRLA